MTSAQKAIDAGHDLSRVLSTDDLVSERQRVLRSDRNRPTASCCKGSASTPGGATTQTLVMRSKSGTIRFMESDHRLSKLRKYAAVQF